jgi:hypothetical protein
MDLNQVSKQDQCSMAEILQEDHINGYRVISTIQFHEE